MRTIITITNMHPRGFAFAVTADGGQIFIPPHVATEHEIAAGDQVDALLTINPNGVERDRTPWLAVKLRPDDQQAAPVLGSDVSTIDRDFAVLQAIQSTQYLTTGEIASQLGIGTTTASNSAKRLFAEGRIAKADVYSKPGQERASFTLWAQDAERFVDVDG